MAHYSADSLCPLQYCAVLGKLGEASNFSPPYIDTEEVANIPYFWPAFVRKAGCIKACSASSVLCGSVFDDHLFHHDMYKPPLNPCYIITWARDENHLVNARAFTPAYQRTHACTQIRPTEVLQVCWSDAQVGLDLDDLFLPKAKGCDRLSRNIFGISGP